ncbi:S-adenosyl-L-methionine-dependent methyltransferase [Rhizoclosmatium globosum]|uniref:S-adenosyl-L-methionine-dependent methyltransferase n=1 Tax=Rhizoclosmatium globosum TaxID=329046 RepID=A0A1Y2BZQ2_9FUNG|nr:S-adenosyl-L-methionine-dependent methyltransferase [Rhizoclosmatium globosum]|eukprot:ORY40241.1 S-adenosyl-L-methionine-dependent methyltransferase [Rhizoclosmatium globosum]
MGNKTSVPKKEEPRSLKPDEIVPNAPPTIPLPVPDFLFGLHSMTTSLALTLDTPLATASPRYPAQEWTAPLESDHMVNSVRPSVNTDIANWRPTEVETERQFYTADTPYILPIDEIEQTRLELQHKMLRLAFGEDVICPEARKLIRSHQTKVLDVGCANGAWMDALFSAGNVNCEYHGVDIAANWFDGGMICGARLEVGNVLERLPYPDNLFDYVHQRNLILAIPKRKWVDVISELCRVTRPGGWIELVECDAVVFHDGPASQAVMKPLNEAYEKRGFDNLLGSSLYDYANDSGMLVNVETKMVSIPVGWGGDAGNLLRKDFKLVLMALQDWMSKVLDVSPEVYKDMVEKANAEWPTTKTFINFHCVYGQVKNKYP